MEDYSKQIHQYLINQNINRSRRGYIYLVAAIESGLNNAQNLYYIMRIYEEVAQKYNLNPNGISKSIRDAIKHTEITAKEFITAAVYTITYNNIWGDSDQEDLKVLNKIC